MDRQGKRKRQVVEESGRLEDDECQNDNRSPHHRCLSDENSTAVNQTGCELSGHCKKQHPTATTNATFNSSGSSATVVGGSVERASSISDSTSDYANTLLLRNSCDDHRASSLLLTSPLSEDTRSRPGLLSLTQHAKRLNCPSGFHQLLLQRQDELRRRESQQMHQVAMLILQQRRDALSTTANNNIRAQTAMTNNQQLTNHQLRLGLSPTLPTISLPTAATATTHSIRTPQTAESLRQLLNRQPSSPLQNYQNTSNLLNQFLLLSQHRETGTIPSSPPPRYADLLFNGGMAQCNEYTTLNQGVDGFIMPSMSGRQNLTHNNILTLPTGHTGGNSHNSSGPVMETSASATNSDAGLSLLSTSTNTLCEQKSHAQNAQIHQRRKLHNRVIQLSLPSDSSVFSPYQTALRAHLELFECDVTDIHTYRTQGRRTKLFPGQVGVRCKHCKSLPFLQRSAASVYFPSRLEGVYQSSQNISTNHLQKGCTSTPETVSNMLQHLQGTSKPGGSKQLWVQECIKIGVENVVAIPPSHVSATTTTTSNINDAGTILKDKKVQSIGYGIRFV